MNPRISTSDMPKGFKLQVVKTAKSAEQFRDRGYTPVEASFGSQCVVDDLELDHHGPMSHYEGVAVRAYRDHFAARIERPWFVTTGFPDEDATFAIAALMGILPHPNNAERFPDAPMQMRQVSRQNLLHVAELINKADIDPDEAVTLVDSHWGRLVLSWRQQAHPTCSDHLAWYGGIDRWRAISTAQSDEVIAAAASSQAEQRELVMSARAEQVGEGIVVADFSTLGRNSSYYKMRLQDAQLLIAFIGGPHGKGTCSFIARDLATAESTLGPGGFIPHYRKLKPGGSGGRETIGGSSRAVQVNWKQALGFGKQLAAIADRYRAV